MVQTKCIMYLHHSMRAHFAAGYEAPGITGKGQINGH